MANPRRPVRIANCSGAQMDPGWQMQRQVAKGNVDFVTGDWLAENNLAQEAEAMAQDPELGFKKNTWDALQRSMDDIARTGIKVIVNGGGLNPASLARRCQELIEQRGHRLQVAFVSGDDVLAQTKAKVVKQAGLPKYFHDDVLESKHDWVNVNVNPLLACNAYIGARGIVKGLTHGADIIICGRVADASPVVAAAWWWHGWKEDDYDRLAGALIAGHLIECSAYITGANFSGFSRYPLATFVDCGYPIAEVCEDGTCVITKPEGTNGLVNKDTVTCQFLYELQGSVYLNSDVKAILDHVEIRDIGPNRVDVRGILGRPPPPTTKLAIFFKGGVETQLLMNASGYATEKKFALFEMQIRFRLEQARLADAFDVLEFQVYIFLDTVVTVIRANECGEQCRNSTTRSALPATKHDLLPRLCSGGNSRSYLLASKNRLR